MCEMPCGRSLPRSPEGWRSRSDGIYCNTKVSELMSTRVGRYLESHPVLALAVLLFGVMATLPVGLFLAFALATGVMAAAACACLEGRCDSQQLGTEPFVFIIRYETDGGGRVFLLSVGGLALLCVLCGLALLSALLSSVLNVGFNASSTICQLFYMQQKWFESDGGVHTVDTLHKTSVFGKNKM